MTWTYLLPRLQDPRFKNQIQVQADDDNEIDLDLTGDVGQDHDDDYVIEDVESPFHQPNRQAEDDRDDEEMKDDDEVGDEEDGDNRMLIFSLVKDGLNYLSS